MKRGDMVKKILENKVDALDRFEALENAVNANAKAAESTWHVLRTVGIRTQARLAAVEDFLTLPWWKRLFRSLPNDSEGGAK